MNFINTSFIPLQSNKCFVNKTQLNPITYTTQFDNNNCLSCSKYLGSGQYTNSNINYDYIQRLLADNFSLVKQDDTNYYFTKELTIKKSVITKNYLEINKNNVIIKLQNVIVLSPDRKEYFNNIKEDFSVTYTKNSQTFTKTIEDDQVLLIPSFNLIVILDQPQAITNLQYSGQLDLLIMQYNLGIKNNVLNKTLNPTKTTIIDNYITSIGLYNKSNQLLAIAKLSYPIKKSSLVDMVLQIRLEKFL